MPHRDFDALYTGLLGYVHAGAMAMAGQDLITLRVVLLVAALLWVPAFWAVAARIAGPAAAAAATLLAVAAGPAVYPASMPSWYNLFLATWGLLALVRWDESGRAGWLVLAGACAGVSLLFKTAGLYFLAAALFFVLHRELGRAERADVAEPGPAGGRMAAPRLGVAAGATLLVLALVALELALVRSQATARAWFHYVLPTLAVGTVAAATAWRPPRPGTRAARRMVAGWLWLGAGFAVPVAAFVAAFAAAGAADDLMRGVLVLPRLRFETAASLPLPLGRTAGVLLPLALLSVEPRLSRGARAGLAAAAAAAGLTLLLLMDSPAVYRGVWHSLQPLVPVATVAACVSLLRRPIGLEETAPEEAVLWAAALFSLVQFPFSGPIYFAYVAPLGVLAALVAVGRGEGPERGPGARPVLAVLGAFYLAFLALGPGRGGHLGPPAEVPLAPLALERGGIRVPATEAREYARAVELLRLHPGGGATYATPDAPEIYFLSGLRNPTRTLFEVFDEPRGRSRRVLAALEAARVDAVALNTRPDFSPPDLELIAELERRYPRAERVGRFIVRWREAADDEPPADAARPVSP